MLGWLKRLFGRNERQLFRYSDGIKRRAADPVATYRELWRFTECDWIEDSKIASNPIGQDGHPVYPIESVYEAEDRLRNLTRHLFGLERWSETQPGLTVDETDELLSSFVLYCAELKKKRSGLRTSLPPTASTEPCGSADTSDCPPNSPPDSACTATASTGGGPSGS